MRRVAGKPGRTRSKKWKVMASLTVCLMISLITYIALGNKSLKTHQIFINGNVITMNPSQPSAQAIVVKRGRIAYVGNNEDALAQQRWYTSVTDLDESTLIPGFVDAHSHFLTTGLTTYATNLNPPPAGDIDSLASLYDAVRDASKKNPDGQWILGFNYDNTMFEGGQHPDRFELDSISTTHPIYLRHHSGHMGVANSKALELLEKSANVTRPKALSPNKTSTDQQTVPPVWRKEYRFNPGNLNDPHIGRYTGTDEPNGLLLEHAAPSLKFFLDDVPVHDFLSMYRLSVKQYLSSGFTTIQEGNAGPQQVKLLRWLSRLSILPLRVVVWLSANQHQQGLFDGSLKPTQANHEWFSADTIKLITDGSPQGYTAYLSRPYHNPRNWNPSHRGSLLMSQQLIEAIMKQAREQNFRLAIHANGDAAIDEVLSAYASTYTKSDADPKSHTDHGKRPLSTVSLVHAQTIRPDQLDALIGTGIALNYFPGHTYFWGDWHQQQSLGPVRAAMISPLRSTLDRNIVFSIHSDAPVTPPDALHMLWTATTRETRSGKLLGENEVIDRGSALRALTADAALVNGLFDRGMIKNGMLADMVVLSGDPITSVDPRELTVIETIIGGKVVYRQPNSP